MSHRSSPNIAKITDQYHSGDESVIENMLLSQAMTLQAMFHSMTRLAFAKKHHGMQPYAEIGLKAQNQCRRTLQALANIKKPTATTFIKQQNNAVNQQVNNCNQAQVKEKNTANELKGKHNVELEQSTTISTGKANQTDQTLVELNGTKDKRRQSS